LTPGEEVASEIIAAEQRSSAAQRWFETLLGEPAFDENSVVEKKPLANPLGKPFRTTPS